MIPNTVLLVGSGGREHALACKLRESNPSFHLILAPGNPGMADLGECVPIPATDLDALTSLAVGRGVNLAVIGPEAPLALGLADRLRAVGVPVFGPSAGAARIESSKAYARELMTRAGVPQPAYGAFTRLPDALEYLARIESAGAVGAVVKASGLAAGKGAVVCPSLSEARLQAVSMLEGGEFGEAGSEIVIEELLEGEEASLLVVCDGERALPLLPAQDHKRAFDGDEGPNTGGMGAYAPAPVLTTALVNEAMQRIVRPVLAELAATGFPFIGCLYAGLMLTVDGLKVIEFNCRFGDPETQVVLPLLDEDFLNLIALAASGRLPDRPLRWKPGRCVGVVLASGGYPGSYETGLPIEGTDAASRLPGVSVFHAGTRVAQGVLVTAGGRVLCVSAMGQGYEEAIDLAYRAAELIRFEGKMLRTDIAARVRGREGKARLI